MKIIVAHSGGGRSQRLKAYVGVLEAALVQAGHEVELLKLPRPNAEDVSSAIASHRLMALDPWCDALICLDAFSAVLKHRRKLLWITADNEIGGGEDKPIAQRFADNAVRAACREADACFALSKSAVREFAKLGLGKFVVLASPVDPEQRRDGGRSPGSKGGDLSPLLTELGA